MTRAFLGLGSNRGDSRTTLAAAVRALGEAPGVRVVARSSLYETDPVGGPPQDDFLNLVVEVETDLDARALWRRCTGIEHALGRDRETEARWGPRAIDIDLLVYDGEVIQEDDLIVPHPRLSTRAFVLVPLAEIAPDLTVPGYGQLGTLLGRLGSLEGVRRLPEDPSG